VVVRAYDLKKKPEALLAAAKHYGVDVESIRKDLDAKPADTATGDLLQVGTQDQQQEDVAEEEEAA
jgi:hypothetical protein